MKKPKVENLGLGNFWFSGFHGTNGAKIWGFWRPRASRFKEALLLLMSWAMQKTVDMKAFLEFEASSSSESKLFSLLQTG